MTDDFERRLRDALRSQRLSVDPAPDLLERIHAGARRRQRRQRAAASGVAAVAVIALAATGVLLRPGQGGTPSTVAGGSETSSTSLSTPTLSAPSVLQAPASHQTSMAFGGAAELSPAGPTPARAPASDVTPVSVTAISTDTFWVLGHRPSAGGQFQTILLRTADSGAHFSTVSEPNIVLAQPLKNPPNARTVSDVRFADADHGWMYGDALYETDDGGATWTPVPSVPGKVVDLVAAPGSVWALTEQTDGSAKRYTLYQASYSGNSAASGWATVKLPFTPTGQQPALALSGGAAYLLGSASPTAKDYLVAIADSTAAVKTSPPCSGDLPARLSAAGVAKVLWATCQTGTEANIYVSRDAGEHWMLAPGMNSNQVLVGGISVKQAITANNGPGLSLLSSDGTTAPVKAPGPATFVSFVGFTNQQAGFAIVLVDGTPQLWRTTDIGSHWSVVTFGG
jgi:hypothetical protein